MRHTHWTTSCLALLAAMTGYGQAYAQEAASSQVSVSTQSNIVYWRSSRFREHGFQWFQPIELQAETKPSSDLRLRFALKSASVYSRYASALGRGTVSTVTDTVARLQAVYEGFEAIQPFISLDLNLPTGRETISRNQRYALMDRDLVPLTRFGEGFNANPSIGFLMPFGQNVVASFAVGHNIRGSYVPDSLLANRYDPGDQTIVTAGLQYADERLTLGLNGILTLETTSTLNGVNFFKPGHSIGIFGRAGWRWNEMHQTSGYLVMNETMRNRTLDLFSGRFGPEDKNGNSRLLVVGASHEITLAPGWAVFAGADYLQRDRNLYDPVDEQFTPAKRKATVEVGVKASFANLEARASIGRFGLKQDATGSSGEEFVRGTIGKISLVKRF